MGGHNAGEVASRMAVELVSQHLCTWWRKGIAHRTGFVLGIQEAIAQANTYIHQTSQHDKIYHGMGSTLTAAGIYDGAVFFAQVGDSRGYCIRANTITQMTRDQSVNGALAAGIGLSADQLQNPQSQHVLLQALGPESQISIPVSFTDLRQGDWVLLCSDGLTNMVSEEEIKDVVCTEHEPRAVCQTLIDLANSNGGRDNITVIAARCQSPNLLPPNPEEEFGPKEFLYRPWWDRFLWWRKKDDSR
jgi:protein phosphatase